VTALDWCIIAVIALSTLFAFIRGFTRELIALLAWIFGVVAAIVFSPSVATWLPDFGANEALRYILAFAIILVVALFVGALVAWPLGSVIRKSGLGFVDRFLGAIFGAARGGLLVLGFVLVAGLTSLPRQDWWQNAALAPALAAAAMAAAPWLPDAWAQRLDYSKQGRTLPKAVEPKAKA
jgi:membrane protein required for colicin V production